MRVPGWLPAVVLSLTASVVVATPTTVEAGAACTGHGRAYLTGFPAGAASPFYSVLDEQGVTAVIAVTPGDCSGDTSQATYATADGTATAPGDYDAIPPGTTGPLCFDAHPEYCAGFPATHPVSISTKETSGGAGPVKSFWFRLTGGTRGLLDPTAAPVHIVDNEGLPRASLEPSVEGTSAVAYSRSETFSLIRIPVFLGGSGSQVSFSIEPEPAAPALPGEDYQVLTPSPLSTFSGGVGFIDVAIVNDRLAESPESVVITLTAVAGGSVAEPSRTTFTILDNEENIRPRTRFHHPKHRKQYRKNDFKIREWHVFYSDEGGSGVVAVQVALRQNLQNGKCKWLTKAGWKRGSCSDRVWQGTKYDEFVDWYVKRMRQLKPSVKTKIKNYTAYARAIDGAGNIERDFIKKRNENTFEIKRSRRR